MSETMTLDKYAEPQEVDTLTMVFPTHVVGKLLPRREELPEEFQDYNCDQKIPECKLAQKWFFNGLDKPLTFASGIDARKAMRHLQACLGSFEPSHEEKIGGVGYLMSIWGAKEP